jgi:hypothetical protein
MSATSRFAALVAAAFVFAVVAAPVLTQAARIVA